jgi:ureidoglycolate lyase
MADKNISQQQQVEERGLPVAEATPEAFAPFGTVIAATQDGAPFDAARDGLTLDRGTPRFYIMKLARRGLVLQQITRHRQVTQCLASVGGKPWYMAVAPPRDLHDAGAEPVVADIRGFRIPCDVAIKLHLGTWHAGPFFDDADMAFFNLELADTNETDHQSCRLDRRFGVRLRFLA